MKRVYPTSLAHWLAEQGLTILDQQSLVGGCIAQSEMALLSNGQRIFIKYADVTTEAVQFVAEKAGLEALRDTSSLSVPEVLFQSEEVLVLEFIEPAARQSSFEKVLAEGLAMQHQKQVNCFGFTMDTYCGRTRQPNTQCDDGYRFFGEQRLLYIASHCHKQRLLSVDDMAQIERLASKLNEWIPEQKPALLHGDLWSGNVHCDQNGLPVLIDPAVYWGWPEADLAMTKLFGGFSSRFYETYTEIMPLEAGWQERMPLYNLWHLLNHLLLFGESYLSDLRAVFKRFN